MWTMKDQIEATVADRVAEDTASYEERWVKDQKRIAELEARIAELEKDTTQKPNEHKPKSCEWCGRTKPSGICRTDSHCPLNDA